MNELIERAQTIAVELKARGHTLSISESSTGGLLSASLLAVPGASAYFHGGAVVYTRKARSLLSGIPDDQMKGIRSSSEPYALLLARTSRARFEGTWALAETGLGKIFQMDETENVSEDSVKKKIYGTVLYTKIIFLNILLLNSSVLCTFIFISGIAANYL